MAAHKTVDDYIREAKQWNDELRHLREIVLSTGLIETVKWGAPVYTNADGKTRLLRQWGMTSATDLKPAIVRRYVREAAAL